MSHRCKWISVLNNVISHGSGNLILVFHNATLHSVPINFICPSKGNLRQQSRNLVFQPCSLISNVYNIHSRLWSRCLNQVRSFFAGVDSLRKCFDYFEEEMEVTYQNRFFRHLDISDNMIKSKERVWYEDKIHDLLSFWVEKVGKEASLNDLLNTLLILNQRRTAEIIRDKAIQHGHYYVCENQREEDTLSETPSEKTQP